MKNTDLSKRDLLPDKMNVDLYVLGATMLDRVRCHVYSADIVTKNHCGRRKGMMELSKKLAYPTTLSNSMCYGPVLCLGTGTGDRSLPFGRPGDQVVAEENTITRG